ncbi:DUF4136 domain-containing protein [Arundinibacter roseus]|uniref:DUF4136 domain-containing protein n=1 Tax=Arundinibacter roseus TaxID=2070510 RepID=A0A4R4K945_9BACT|nr:DUF4136 domain-containing protein [Arundinibacter roseus]TDB64190.1 DUF4136 domain-containing protein [Arundinibacter roseus]
MKYVIKSVLILVSGVIFFSCSQAFQVQNDYDRSVNLKQFKTFRVEMEKEMTNDPIIGSELNSRRILGAVAEVMEQKGYRQVENNPELVVRYLTDVKDRQQVRSNGAMSPYWWWYGPQNNNISTYNYQEGRLIVNIYQNGTNSLIWQGWASGRLKAPSKREDRDAMIKGVIGDILRTFPQATADTYSNEIGER